MGRIILPAAAIPPLLPYSGGGRGWEEAGGPTTDDGPRPHVTEFGPVAVGEHGFVGIIYMEIHTIWFIRDTLKCCTCCSLYIYIMFFWINKVRKSLMILLAAP